MSATSGITDDKLTTEYTAPNSGLFFSGIAYLAPTLSMGYEPRDSRQKGYCCECAYANESPNAYASSQLSEYLDTESTKKEPPAIAVDKRWS